MLEPYFRASGERARQKAIILNADVFIGRLYPGIDTIAPTMGNRIPVAVAVFGPGGRGEHDVTHIIQKAAKNWRLSGKLILNPVREPTRYNSLQEGDLGIFLFDGHLVSRTVRNLVAL
jgi:hypothetical protein